MRRIVLLLSLFTLSGLFITSGVYAQITTAQVSGKVSGAAGQSLQGATIRVVNPSTGGDYATQTNADGRYFLPNLNPGQYVLTITSVGYKKVERNDINLVLGNNTFNFQLEEEAGQLGNVVVKTGKKAGTKTGAGIAIGQNQIKNLPSISRSLQDFTRLTPQSSNNSFLGTNFRYNNVTLDGAINNDAIGFSPSLGGQTNSSGQLGSSTRSTPVSLDAIQDIQVYVAPYDIKIGNVLGGSINAVTRSGTNDFHGSIYGFGSAGFLVGPNNAGDGAKEPSSYHNYTAGVRLGFPLIKNKLFFFTNEELVRRRDPVISAAGSAGSAAVLSQADAQAIAAKMSSLGFDAGTYDNTTIYSNSQKFFNRLDWYVDSKNQLTIRNNTITSTATNLERDQQNFRFGGIDYKSTNNQTSTVAEFKTRFNNSVSNSLVMGYTNVHDYRTPNSNPALPQYEITGRTPGTTIFLGTDREAAIFDMRQKTFEFTDNVTLNTGKHTFTFGTHNELYDIQYGFVNAWNGRDAFKSIEDFLAQNPSRVRANYNYTNNTRDYILAHPGAKFNVNLYSLYAQDEVAVTDKFKLNVGIRADYAGVPDKQPLSTKTTTAPVDLNYGKSFSYTLPKDIQNKYLNNVEINPRVSFNYDIKGDQSIVLRGGTGLFTGRIPFAWMGYAFYNNGVTYGAYDNKAPKPGVNTIQATPIGGAQYPKDQGINVNDATGATQVDLIDNKFKMPQAWRSSLALDYATRDQWKFTIEGIYTKVVHDLKFQQVNTKDSFTYYKYDVNHEQPIFVNKGINPLFTNAYLLSNTSQGYRYSITGQVSKSFPFGLSAMVAYTYGTSKDITNGIRNSMESNWQLNQALNPNNPTLANSNFDIRHRIVSTVNYRLDWNKANKFVSNFSLFFSAQSGTPFSYGFYPSAIDGTGQQVSLAYIPKAAETINFFEDLKNASGVVTKTAAQQAAEFDAYVNSNKYLSSRRGKFTERNGARTPWNNNLDFRFAQDFNFGAGKHKQTITFTFDIINLTNLLSKSWGHYYFSPNTYNSTSSVGLTPKTTPAFAAASSAYPTYTFTNPGTPYAVDYFTSRYQMQFGIRYSF